MSGKTKAVICYVAALVYTFGGIWMLKALFGDAFRNLPGWASAGLYLVFIVPLLALVAYGYGQWLGSSARAKASRRSTSS